jgi:hypothetical protein
MMDGMSLPADNRRGPNCGVTAIAIVAEISFAEAWEALAKARPLAGHRKPTGGWKGRTTAASRRVALELLGVSCLEVPLPWRGCMTLATFVKRCAKPGRRYLVTTSGHAQVVQNGHVADQTGSHPIALYWGRNKRVTHLVEVMP